MNRIGRSYSEILSSLSAQGSVSSELTNYSLSELSQTKPLTNYSDLSKHVYFSDAITKTEYSLEYLRETYPIGLSGAGYTSLSSENIYLVNTWKKKSTGYDIWLLQQLSDNGSITASASSETGDNVPLPWIQRDLDNSFSGIASLIASEIEEKSRAFEEENTLITSQTPGYLYDETDINSQTRREYYSSTAEEYAVRFQRAKSLLPEILFAGDQDDVFEKIVDSSSEVLDTIKEYIDQISKFNSTNYQNIDRIPNKFIPVLAKHYGVELFQSSVNDAITSFFSQSSSGYTSQEINYEIWNRILNNLNHLLKSKGTKSLFTSIGNIYGLDQHYLRANEYSILDEGQHHEDIDEIAFSALYSEGVNTAQYNVGSSIFDFDPYQDFTIETRVSITAAIDNHLDQKICIHPAYELLVNSSGQAIFHHINESLCAYTDQTSLSSKMSEEDVFINVAVVRKGDDLKIYTMALSGSGTADEDCVYSTSGIETGVELHALTASSGFISFPGENSFTGYLHEVRIWDKALEEDDLIEHCKNFESISFRNTAKVETISFDNLLAHYKLKENVLFSG